VRLEDWQGSHEQEIYRNLEDFSHLLETFLSQHKIPCITIICPSSPQKQIILEKVEQAFRTKLNNLPGSYLVTQEDLSIYPVDNYYDQTRDRLGHIPFTPLFFTSLATIIARKIYSLKTNPYKVIVLDCDNTIWQGIVGEDSVKGIKITDQYRELQKFMLKQKDSGKLLSLCSKNTESDVLEVFKNRDDLELKVEDLVSWKINWQAKSENLKALAEELNLGLDSFIFIDDNPLECAEVKNHCPEVLTINLPIEKDLVNFLNHIWAFDYLQVTEEDQKRTKLYQENLERDRFANETNTLEDFLTGLQLKIDITEPSIEQIPRVAQLTQRTNQFNLTTKRYSEIEIANSLSNQLGCRIVQVKDRFGDYGLVGVILFFKNNNNNTLVIDTFLLSCRVLGRGVEYKMLQLLGNIARENNQSQILAPYLKTKKNLPVLNFLEKVGEPYQNETEEGYDFVFPTEYLVNLNYAPNSKKEKSKVLSERMGASPPQSTNLVSKKITKIELIEQIATQLNQVELIYSLINQQKEYSQREILTTYIPATTFTEQQLAKIWSKLLVIENIGIDDNYFELGGTSLQAVELFTQIEKEFSTRLALTTLIESPTIRQLSELLNQEGQLTTNNSLVLIAQGDTHPPLFLVHDGFGETLLYRNLANKLQPTRAVYGLQPLSKKGYPILHTRIPDMAAFYIEQIRNIQPQGPYFLGGMCAGGVIAFEMALQLQKQGEKIAVLALIDSAAIGIAKQTKGVNEQRLNRFSSAFVQTGHLSVKDRLLEIIKTIQKKTSNVIIYESSQFIQRSKCYLLDFSLRYKLPLSSLLENLGVNLIYSFAETQYTFIDKFKGDILLFRATSGQGVDQPFKEIYLDPLLGWSEQVSGIVHVIDIPGGHSSILQEPNVDKMREELENYLIEF
jgi:FkbH-like protein